MGQARSMLNASGADCSVLLPLDPAEAGPIASTMMRSTMKSS
jgi:hypothetical protein